MSEDPNDSLENIDYSKLRKHNRYNLITPCTIVNLGSNTKFETFITTISLGGISFIFPEILANGTILRVEFDMPNGAKVNKHIEIKRFKRELKKFQTPVGVECIGFEHGSRFIIFNEKSGKPDVIEDVPVPELPKPKEEIFKKCFYHLEMYRNGSNVLRHGYVVQLGEKHIFFNSWIELQKGEKIFANIVMVEDDSKKEEPIQLEVKEISKEGKLFSVKGLLLE